MNRSPRISQVSRDRLGLPSTIALESKQLSDLPASQVDAILRFPTETQPKRCTFYIVRKGVNGYESIMAQLKLAKVALHPQPTG